MFLMLLGLITFAGANHAFAQNSGDDDGISTELTAGNKDAIFSDRPSYTFKVKNATNSPQTGTVSYLITQFGKTLKTASQKVNLGKNSSEKYSFDFPSLPSGFYKINFMVNISDYDDTTRKAFGIRPSEIRSQYPKPADFDDFWIKTKAELAAVKPDYKLTLMPKMGTKDRKVYLIEMRSLDNYLIRGWMTIPSHAGPKDKFAVLLGLPGYQVDLKPILGNDDDLAIITLNVRGQGNSRGPINTRREEYIFYRIEDRNNYIMRGVIMDCIRAVDFIYAQPYLNHDNIYVSGGSMGGYLALATAGLDKRVNLCSAENPILCDIGNLDGESVWPMGDIKRYVRTQPGVTFDKVLSNLSYYDGKNFAAHITCPIMMGIGLLDPLAPPYNEFAAFNLIPGTKRIMVFKDLAHETAPSYKNLTGRWMRDYFALF